MWLHKLELNNFGPYEGKLELNFKKENGQNIWIISGKNGAGKTHIYEAIKWALYGYDPKPGEKWRDPTQKDAWIQMYGSNLDTNIPPNPHMHVILWFKEESEKNNRNYVIKRRAFPKSRVNVTSSGQIEVTLSVTENGVETNNPRQKINTLLPLAASQFFMFHGSEINKISQKHEIETRDAIELIIEAETFRQGRDDLKTVLKRIESDSDDETSKDERKVHVINAKKEAKSEFDELCEKLKKTKEDLSENNDKLISVEKELSKYGSSEKLLGMLSGHKSQLTNMTEEREREFSRRSILVSDLPLKLILSPLENILETKKIQHDKLEKQKTEITKLIGKSDYAESILNQGKCICGREMGLTQREYIQGEKKFHTNKLSEIESKLIKEDPTYFDIKETITYISSKNIDFEQFQHNINRLNLGVDEVQQNINDINQELDESAEDTTKKLGAKRKEIIHNIGTLEERIRNYEADIITGRSNLAKIDREINQGVVQSNIKKFLENQFALAEKCHKSFNYILENLVEDRKNALEENASIIFQKLTNKKDEYDKIKISDNYNISVIDMDGCEVRQDSLSTGEKEVVALSFILGLMKASEKVSPLVLDTFFVNLDESHFKNIVDALPDFASQIILLLTDLEYANLKQRVSETFFDNVSENLEVIRNQKEKKSSIVTMDG